MVPAPDIVLAEKLLYEDSIFIKRKEFEIEQEWRLVLDDEIEKTRDDWEYYYNWKNEECNSQDFTDNKCLKNERKTSSSSYPPRSSSDEIFCTDYFIWQVVYEVTCHVYIVSMRINRR